MFLSRIVIRNFRSFNSLDLALHQGANCVVGANNSGKTNLLYAIRLLLDQELSGYARRLQTEDIHAGVDLAKGEQVVISIEFSDYLANDLACALVSEWEVAPDLARLTYRFRPSATSREELESGQRQEGTLTIDDYEWEIRGGGPEEPVTLGWADDHGRSFRLNLLQAFHVTYLHPLRDVQRDLRGVRTSPLNRVIDALGVPESEKEALVDALLVANEKIADAPAIKKIGSQLRQNFKNTTGPGAELDLKLGLASPTFATVTRALRILLSDMSLTDFDTSRNGLGLNNVLYVSLLLQHFEARAASDSCAGQLLLFEEPEAHLHPQLQRTLYGVLAEKEFQSILTTHSTHITSRAPLSSVVSLNRGEKAGGQSLACSPAAEASLTARQVADLERYLDATRSTLLFARAVMFVEGPAEQFLIPALIRGATGMELESHGISVIPIYGTHFEVYVSLFVGGVLGKKCAVVGDADLKPSDATGGQLEPNRVTQLRALEDGYVRVFLGDTTFERELVLPGLLEPLLEAAKEFGKVGLVRTLERAIEKAEISEDTRDAVLNAAKQIGKARFAQVLSKYVAQTTEVPDYVLNAFGWLIEE